MCDFASRLPNLLVLVWPIYAENLRDIDDTLTLLQVRSNYAHSAKRTDGRNGHFIYVPGSTGKEGWLGNMGEDERKVCVPDFVRSMPYDGPKKHRYSKQKGGNRPIVIQCCKEDGSLVPQPNTHGWGHNGTFKVTEEYKTFQESLVACSDRGVRLCVQDEFKDAGSLRGNGLLTHIPFDFHWIDEPCSYEGPRLDPRPHWVAMPREKLLDASNIIDTCRRSLSNDEVSLKEGESESLGPVCCNLLGRPLSKADLPCVERGVHVSTSSTYDESNYYCWSHGAQLCQRRLGFPAVEHTCDATGATWSSDSCTINVERICTESATRTCVSAGSLHFLSSFYDSSIFYESTQFAAAGLFRMASAFQGDFDIQSFHCPTERKEWAVVGPPAVLHHAFAMRIQNVTVVIVADEVRANGVLLMNKEHVMRATRVKHDLGAVIVAATHGESGLRYIVRAKDECLRAEFQYIATEDAATPYFYTSFIKMPLDAVHRGSGLCAAPLPFSEDVLQNVSKSYRLSRHMQDFAKLYQVPESDSLFDTGTLERLRTECNMTFGYPEAPAPVSSPKDLCRERDVSMVDVQNQCATLLLNDLPSVYDACLYDGCASPRTFSYVLDAYKALVAEVAPEVRCLDPRDCRLRTACEHCPELYFGNLASNDLAGSGVLRFAKVLNMLGADIDLVITATDGYHGNPRQSGADDTGSLLHLHIKANVTKFTFDFVDSATGTPVVLPHLCLTVFDVDHGDVDPLPGREYVESCLADNAVVYVDHELNITTPSAGCFAFSSVAAGNKMDNPKPRTPLTPLQKARTLTYTYSRVSSVALSIGILGAVPGGREFLLAGAPTVPCAFKKFQDIR